MASFSLSVVTGDAPNLHVQERQILSAFWDIVRNSLTCYILLPNANETPERTRARGNNANKYC